MGKAALRHYRCAKTLASKREESEASYLIGLAAECAIKHHLQKIGFFNGRAQGNAVAPMYAHFPELKQLLVEQAGGVLAARLLTRLRDPATMQGWSVKLRYQDGSSSAQVVKRYNAWLEQTDDFFLEVGLL